MPSPKRGARRDPPVFVAENAVTGVKAHVVHHPLITNGRQMDYLYYYLTAVWITRLLFFAGVSLNDFRRVLNNLLPNAPFAGEVFSWKIPLLGSSRGAVGSRRSIRHS